MAGLNDAPLVQSLAVPAVCLLIAFLGYASQLVLHRAALDPGPPSRAESVVFNGLLLCLCFTYFRAVTVDPGRYVFPPASAAAAADADAAPAGRWCRKCAAPKPPRAHHCRRCGRCVPKMDHHCPWTRNCVSATTFPHFLRFLAYCNLSLAALARLLWPRLCALWRARHLPAYLGPSLPALVALALTTLVCLFTALALALMLLTTLRAWLFNCTMIEGWELERHEAALGRDGRDWWHAAGPDGETLRLERVEFPYDIGLFANMSQAMGTSNPLLWFFPFAGNPRVGAHGRGVGWAWEENGFNRREGMWPPPDPDKIRRAARRAPASRGDDRAVLLREGLGLEEQKRAFRRRQEADARRRKLLLAELEETDECDLAGETSDSDETRPRDSWWVNPDGDRLRDYGVDDEAEDADVQDFDDEDVPLGELLRRRRAVSREAAA